MISYLLHESNPLVLVGHRSAQSVGGIGLTAKCSFLFILTTAVFLFLKAAYFNLPTIHRIIVPLLIACPYAFTYLSVTSTASYITPLNYKERLHDYPFDHALFRPGNVCHTCNFEKPARSKHCSYCRACVAKCDHHCPWVNNCLGRENYRWFVLLLLSLGILNYYGAYLSFQQLWPQLHLSNLAHWGSRAFWDQIGTELSRAFEIGGLSIAGVGMLALLTGPLPFGLLAYHIYLIWAGMTTNESQKWTDLREDMADGLVFRCRRDQAPYDLTREPRVPWPISSDQVIINTADGRPPGDTSVFERVWDLASVQNIYDLGGLDNLLYILRAQ